MPESDWVDASLAGDLDNADRIQYREAIAARTDLPTVKEDLEDYLPLKPTPRTECPGFERLCKIMDIPADPPEKDLVEYKPIWSGVWGTSRVAMMEALASDDEELLG